MGAGIDHGAAELFVSQEPLNRGHPAACIEQLRSTGMSESVREYFYTHLPAYSFEPVSKEVPLQRRIAIQEDMVATAFAPYCQICLQGMNGSLGEIDRAILFALALYALLLPALQFLQRRLFYQRLVSDRMSWVLITPGQLQVVPVMQ